MADELVPTSPGEFLIYQTDDGTTRVQVRFVGDTVWLSQKLIAELFQVTVPTVNEHLANIYDEGELSPEATIRKFRIAQTEGARQVPRLVDHYNLGSILAVGYRVRSYSVFGLKGRFCQPRSKTWVPDKGFSLPHPSGGADRTALLGPGIHGAFVTPPFGSG